MRDQVTVASANRRSTEYERNHPGDVDRLASRIIASCCALVASGRAWNIAFRTSHIAATGALLGGHAWNVPAERLLTVLGLAVATGIALGAMEAGPRLVWFHQGRGLMTMGKLLLVAAVPFCWPYRVPILLAVVVLASVGAHMPAKFRYYSIVYRRVIRCGTGPGLAGLDDGADQP